MNELKDIIQSNRIWFCLDCGKCSSVCPITRHGIEPYTSPRLLVETAINLGRDAVLNDPLLWSCLTCNLCTEICPSQVSFSNFVQNVRKEAKDQNLSVNCTHSGVIQTWSRMMSDSDLMQNRLDWIDDGLQISEESDTVLFTGCLPYYDAAFSQLDIEGTEIARAALKILNYLGIEPIVLKDERCCGHDQYWQGDMNTYQKLGETNIQNLKGTGATRIVTTCPECAWTLKHTYPETIGDTGMEVYHLAELLAETDLVDTLLKNTDNGSKPVTYQDPCRLGRFSGVYQQPRELIQGLGYEFREMSHNRKSSLCCGTSCWTSCGEVNKKAQVERLDEAKSTGAELLITACIKCQIHLKCAQKDPVLAEDIQIKIRDLTTLIAEHL
ncbi:MAG: (Fe-S)-binding protein [Anaerolineales bacterium]|nr:(Fe-S)-binding protein [Anaerolineales bacterium]